MFQFAWPWVFLLLPLPLVIYHWLPPASAEKTAVVVPFYRQLTQAAGSPGRFGNISRGWLPILMAIIWLLLLASAARPQWIGSELTLPTSGRDLLLAVDISESMKQKDMISNNEKISRLEAVKHVVSEFIERRQGDRVGLILFGSNAYLQAPLTFDTATVARFMQEAQLGFAGPRTAIGNAIGLSVKRLQELESSSGNSQVVVLLTDGANTSGEIKPLQAADLARQTKIKVYTVGVGADEMFIRGFFGMQRVNPSAQLDEQTLVSIAEKTGGKYFRAREAQELEDIYRELDRLEPVEQNQQWFRPTKSFFTWPLLAALALSILPVIRVWLSNLRIPRTG